MLKWNFLVACSRHSGLNTGNHCEKEEEKVTKSQDGKRWRQVWFRGARLCRVRRNLCLIACFQYTWCLHWEHNFRGRVIKGMWSHLASWCVLVTDKCLLLIKLGLVDQGIAKISKEINWWKTVQMGENQVSFDGLTCLLPFSIRCSYIPFSME